MKKSFISVLYVAAAMAFMLSCVPARKFDEIKKKKEEKVCSVSEKVYFLIEYVYTREEYKGRCFLWPHR